MESSLDLRVQTIGGFARQEVMEEDDLQLHSHEDVQSSLWEDQQSVVQVAQGSPPQERELKGWMWDFWTAEDGTKQIESRRKCFQKN